MRKKTEDEPKLPKSAEKATMSSEATASLRYASRWDKRSFEKVRGN